MNEHLYTVSVQDKKTKEKLKLQVRKLEAVPHRLQLLRRGGITIIDDAYNANPEGCLEACRVLSRFENKNRYFRLRKFRQGG